MDFKGYAAGLHWSEFYADYPTKLHTSRALNLNHIIGLEVNSKASPTYSFIVYKINVTDTTYPNPVDMRFLVVLIAFSYTVAQKNDLMKECAKYYRPKNYLDTLAQMKLPYIAQLPVPNNLKNIISQNYMNKLQNIVPTPVMTTKVLTVHTKYVYQNPVCVKYSKKQKLCKSPGNGSFNKLVTKQHFLKSNIEERVEGSLSVTDDDTESDRFTLKVSFDKLGKLLILSLTCIQNFYHIQSVTE